MRNLKDSAADMRPVKKEINVMDLDSDDEVNEYMMDAELSDTSPGYGVTNRSNMQQILCAAVADDDDDWDTRIDPQFMMLLDSFREEGSSYLRENPLRCIRYDVDNGGYDKREFKVASNKRSREHLNVTRVTKKNVESKPNVQASTRRTKKEVVHESRRRESLADEKSVGSMLITNHVKRNPQRNVDGRKNENSEREMVCDENYRSYLTWLVENSRRPRISPEKEINVKCEEEDTMSLSDSDIVEVEDSPFLDEEDSPFVPSKDYKVTDLEEERRDEPSSLFKKEIMNILKQPYKKEELEELYKKASVHTKSTRYIELRNGTDFSFDTNQKRPSYLNMYPEFEKKLEAVREKDPHRALNLLRGFIFYLTNVARHDAFEPWRNRECLQITCI